MKLLVTGGAGFIGSNFIRLALSQRRDWQVINFDALTYSGNLENLAEVAEHKGYEFVRGDIADAGAVEAIMQRRFDAIVNFAAETHVDRSIEDASPFLRTNVLGTQVLLDAVRRRAKTRPLKTSIQISTDEVYGSAGPGESFDERQICDPQPPYWPTTAPADQLLN